MRDARDTLFMVYLALACWAIAGLAVIRHFYRVTPGYARWPTLLALGLLFCTGVSGMLGVVATWIR